MLSWYYQNPVYFLVQKSSTGINISNITHLDNHGMHSLLKIKLVSTSNSLNMLPKVYPSKSSNPHLFMILKSTTTLKLVYMSYPKTFLCFLYWFPSDGSSISQYQWSCNFFKYPNLHKSGTWRRLWTY